MRTKKQLFLALFATLALVLGALACSDDDSGGTKKDGSTGDGGGTHTGSGAKVCW